MDSFAQALITRGGNTFRLVRVIADYNNDGYDDIAVTGANNTDRQGEKWRLYLGNKTGFTNAGEIYFDPHDSYLAPLDRGATSLIVFTHRGGSRCFTEYLLKNSKLKECRSGTVSSNGRGTVLSSRHCNVFRNKAETCPLPAYTRARNCLWHRTDRASLP